MAATEYSYSISEDFPNQKVAVDRLTKEIETSDISTTLDYITANDDDCDIWFEDELSAGDQTILDGIVDSHDGTHLPDICNTLATTNPTANDDKNNGYGIGSRWINTNLKFEFICVDDSVGAAIWLLLNREIADIHMSFGGDLTGYCKCGLTSWDVQRRFIFRGTDVLGTPTAFKAIVAVSANTGDIRLYDATNSNIIAVIYNYTNTSWDIVTDSNLSNLPTGEAMFEIQLKVDNEGDWNYLSGASLIF